ncbi:hypothetical protein NUW54_g12922 [Trametes sanguinea]|uniref:Uncharacterized protein n=1 Tax=Trametes sanguinea TaxID=158606 RepID=A0ACC1MTM1_9APHY|nr:hypothetical protein NUW54_g12922 [Trametes sanguinea]
MPAVGEQAPRSGEADEGDHSDNESGQRTLVVNGTYILPLAVFSFGIRVPVGTTVMNVLVIVMPSVVNVVFSTTVVNRVVDPVTVVIDGVAVGPRTGRDEDISTEDERRADELDAEDEGLEEWEVGLETGMDEDEDAEVEREMDVDVDKEVGGGTDELVVESDEDEVVELLVEDPLVVLVVEDMLEAPDEEDDEDEDEDDDDEVVVDEDKEVVVDEDKEVVVDEDKEVVVEDDVRDVDEEVCEVCEVELVLREVSVAEPGEDDVDRTEVVVVAVPDVL